MARVHRGPLHVLRSALEAAVLFGRFLLGLFLFGLCVAGCDRGSEPSVEGEVVPLEIKPNESGHPDVVLVMLDTLRPDFLGLYGHERETAPFLSELAETSTVFRRAYSTSSWTAPATASLFTSTYPTQHGLTVGFFASRAQQRRAAEEGSATLRLSKISPSLPTLPELFRDAGYRTFAVAANVNIGAELGFARGFDHMERLHGKKLGDFGDAHDLEAQLDAWSTEIRDADPAFVYLHFNDAHKPYHRNHPWYQPPDRGPQSEEVPDEEVPDEMPDEVPDEVAKEVADDRAAYESEIRKVDETLRRLFTRFGWAAEGSEAVVAIVSDHGEEFLDHGGRYHRPTLYRELVQVVTLIRAPDGTPRRVDANVSLLDVLPTLLDLAGLPPPPHAEGVSLAPLVEAPASSEDDRALLDRLASRALFAHRRNPRREEQTLRSVLDGDLQLIESNGRVQLFDLARDPRQQHDLAQTHPEDVARLRARLRAFESLPRAGEAAEEVELDAEAMEQLRALGYVE